MNELNAEFSETGEGSVGVVGVVGLGVPWPRHTEVPGLVVSGVRSVGMKLL